MMPLEALAYYLTGLGLATAGTDLFLRPLDAPDDLVALIEYAAPPGGWRNEDGLSLNETPRFQLFVRSKSYDAARDRATTIHDALHIMNKDVQGVHFYKVRAVQRPFHLRRDAADRSEFVANFEIHNLR